MEHFDVAIAGGGPAGSAAAIVLARRGHRVFLANADFAGRLRVGEGLPPAAHSLLEDLGVLERFQTDAHRISFGNVSLWGSEEPQITDFIHQVPSRGYQLERDQFDAMLRIAAVEAGALVCEGGRLTDAKPNAEPAEGHVVRLIQNGRSHALSCKWLVDAGGRSASLSRQLGAKRHRLDRLIGFSMALNTTSNCDVDGRTLVEADELGWWYSALLPSGVRLVTYLTDVDLADRPTLRSSEGLWAKLSTTRMLSDLCIMHGYTPLAPPRVCDASTGRLDVGAGPSWLAAGDAVLSFDPLSSQGIANALYTGLQGAFAVDAAFAGNTDQMATYVTHLANIYHAYLGHRYSFYAMEKRWPDSLFWRRRHVSPYTFKEHDEVA